jgi:hypothetical protein
MRKRTRLSALALFSALLAVWASGTSATQPAGIDSKLILEEFAVARDGDGLLLPVRVNGKEYYFLLDTGAQYNIFDQRLLGPKNGEATMDAFGRDVTTSLSDAPEATVGRIPFAGRGMASAVSGSPPRVVGLDLGRLREVSGRDIYGMIGMEFLRDKVVRIDCDRGKVTFLKSVPEGSGEPVPIYRLDDPPRPHVYVDIEGWALDTLCQIDTGMVGSEGILPKATLKSLAEHGKAERDQDWRALDAAGEQRGTGYRVGSVSVGGFSHHKVYFHAGLTGVLGLGYLSRYVITFDFPDRTMYLVKGKRFSTAEDRRRIGVALYRRNGKTLVGSVDPGSPADRGGVHRGDELLKVGDEPVERLSLFVLHRVLSRNRRVQLALRRGTRELHVRIETRAGDGAAEPR